MTELIVLSMAAALGSPVIVLSKVAVMTGLPCAGPPVSKVKSIGQDTSQRELSPHRLSQKSLFGNILFPTIAQVFPARKRQPMAVVRAPTEQRGIMNGKRAMVGLRALVGACIRT